MQRYRSQIGISLLLFVVAFLFRYSLFSFVNLPWIIYDEYIYLDTARQILRGSFITHLTLENQIYPPGWSVMLAAVVGFISNPITQYRAALIFTMMLSSSIPVIAYWYTKKLVPALLLIIFMPLVVYSNSIMSETLYTLSILLFIITMHCVVDNDLKETRHIILSAVVTGFFLSFIGSIRSFGVVVPSSFALAFVLCIIAWRHQHEVRSRLLWYLGGSLISLAVSNFLLGLLMPSADKLYNIPSYNQAITTLFIHPILSFKMIANQLTAIGLEMAWFPLLAFGWKTWTLFRETHKKGEHASRRGVLVVRAFLVFLLMTSFGLTLLHMARDVVKNPQYLLFTRYMDPVLVVMFMFGVADGLEYLKKQKRHFPSVLYAVLGVWLLSFVYLYFGFFRETYKFGNTMAVYFLREEQTNLLWEVIAPSLLLGGVVWIGLWKQSYKVSVAACILLTAWITWITIPSAREVPRYVVNDYHTYVVEWDDYMGDSRYPLTVCRMGKTIKNEVYYMYSFLYPYHYLESCDSPKDVISRRVMVNSYERLDLLQGYACQTEYAFRSGDMVYYCPQ
ncbi:hypothetical protein COU89_03665 [Candidatus Roizmanbacteria bacterium CG10_big_fil_rev_8_21_14_0_10_45_7]|uniref:Glycosyltransferase RgtA/B/C/D-like domain-containing protein n=1 Tax=Candidatus Roizmanbacteria bacterium CG10_big_fil_rev_8_21_14_0_10_45_7 TaxID=1974854 RepID=A0A2M8KTW3_9BACT|nr:MAG: hypothetical protein COU89_03665 [Candidatus Roizmanbacteria bacterium CG10_big_fil_rev_8_21_14_0_10_45_7]